MASPGCQGEPYGWFSGWHFSICVFTTMCSLEDQSTGSGEHGSPTTCWLKSSMEMTHGLAPVLFSSSWIMKASRIIQVYVNGSFFSGLYNTFFLLLTTSIVLNALCARSYLVLTIALRSRYSQLSLWHQFCFINLLQTLNSERRIIALGEIEN